MDKIWMGIDPGLGGGVGFINNGKTNSFHTPTLKNSKGKNQFNTPAMVDIITGSGTYNLENIFCIIEAVHSMPGQGCVSVFSFGYGYGLWVGIVAALGIPYQLVAPQTWKKSLLQDTLKDKTASIVLAQQLFPDFHAKFKKDEALAEALLLAEYGRRIHK